MIRRIGIDFGTCNIKGAEKKKNGDIVPVKLGKQMDKPRIPNVIIYEKKEDGYSALIGDVALKKPVSEQDRIRGIKSSLQEKGWKRELSFGKTVNAEEVTFDIMHCLYQGIYNTNKNREIAATITVPVNFSARQQHIVENAAIKAGFQVEAVISEPFAAVFYLMQECLEEEGEEEHNVLVFDLGGGTLDLCLASIREGKNGKIIETESSVGITYGGNNISEDILTDILAKRCPEEVDKALNGQENALRGETNRYFLMEAIDGAKGELFGEESGEAEVLVSLYDGSTIDFGEISVEEIYHLLDARDMKKRIWRLLDSLYEDSDVIVGETTDVFVVGGSSSIPYFRNVLEEYFDKNASQSDLELLFERNDEMELEDRLFSSVAGGAVIYQELSDNENIIIKERIPFVIYTKDDSGRVVTKLTKNDCYKDYFSAYAGITDKMRETRHISVYQTIFGEEEKEVYLGDVMLDDEIVRDATLYKLKVDQHRNIQIVFGLMPSGNSKDSEDQIYDEWEKGLLIK